MKFLFLFLIVIVTTFFYPNISYAEDIKIISAFDSGNIEIVKVIDYNDIELNIRKDNNAEYFQWFYFKLQGAKSRYCIIKILNSGKSSFARGWENYQALASYDRKEWFRVPTSFDGKVLEITHRPEYNSVYYAYFIPYSFERTRNLIDKVSNSDLGEVVSLGKTIDGKELNLIIMGKQTPEKKKVWIITGQHPGETMGLWFVEGVVKKLLEKEDPVSRSLLEKIVFYIVPNMNIDGNIRGNHRTNAKGKNLNREWLNPSMDNSPEVFLVRDKINNTGVNLFLDIHGDETLAYNFAVANEGIPSYNNKIKDLEDDFINTLIKINPDFQNEKGYGKDKPGKANLSIASKYIGEKFNCLSFTIEMPYKDNASFPDKKYGWTGIKSIKLGESTLQVISILLNKL